jgi:hypothetical protein
MRRPRRADMNSKDVNKAIRLEIRPLLKEVGFTTFTSRTAWRFLPDRTDVVNFQSFNSYNAEGLRCTTFSFSVNLGCHLAYVPEVIPGYMKTKDGRLLPAEYQCPFRRGLRRTFGQPELERRDIWYIDPGGRYIAKALHDARMVLSRTGLPWFDQFSDRAEVLRGLLENNENMSGMWGFGAPDSPRRCYLIGYIARSAAQPKLAREYLLRAADTESYADVADRLRQDAQSVA